MHYTVLASDYDGTLATHGELRPHTVEALRRVADSGRKLVLVTGRTLDGLALICPEADDVFDVIVAENGAVLRERDGHRTTLLAEPLPDDFAAACRRHGVPEMHVGQVIASTWEHFREGVESALSELHLDARISLNKGSLMILPSHVDKASGLEAALELLDEPATATVALGDAENDVPMLDLAGCGVAVANALDEVKQHADIVTVGTHGDGAIEVLDALLADDLTTLQKPAAQRVG